MSLQVSKALVSLQKGFNSAIIWMVPILLLSLIHPVFFTYLWVPFQANQLQLVSTFLSCSIAFSAFLQDPSIYRFLTLYGPLEQQTPASYNHYHYYYYWIFRFTCGFLQSPGLHPRTSWNKCSDNMHSNFFIKSFFFWHFLVFFFHLHWEYSPKK